jgi:hypothetical protein
LDDGDVKINLYQLMAIILCVAFIWIKFWIGFTIQSNTGHSLLFFGDFLFWKTNSVEYSLFFKIVAKNLTKF